MKKRIISLLPLALVLAAVLCAPALALTEAEVEAQVAATSKEAVTGSVLIWFLCAVAFLKVSQKIDSFLATMGVNVGRTGGSMLAEAMIAARGVSMIAKAGGHVLGGFGHSGGAGANQGASGSPGGFFKGGLIGMAGRHVTSDQDSTFDFRSSLFLSFIFIKLYSTRTNSALAVGTSKTIHEAIQTGKAISAAAIDEILVEGVADAQNLSLFLSDGSIQHTEYSGGTITSLGDVRFTDGVTEVVYFNQLDQRYANQPYGTDNIGGYGCGPTAMSIVVSSLTNEIVDPTAMAKWAYENGGWCKGQGSYHSLIPNAAKAWGLTVEGCRADEPQRILDALSQGRLVVAIMGKGHFTTTGHFIVLRGVQDGKLLVADPASTSRSWQAWDLSIILNEAGKRAGAGGPFWIVGA